MPRANIWLVLIVIASMLGVWYFGSVHPGSQSEAAPRPETEEPLETPARSTPSRQDTRRAQLQRDLENLQADLLRKTQQIEAQRVALDKLYQQQSVLAGSANFRSQIQTRDLAIQNLVEDLGNYRQAEEDINQSAALALKNQDSQAALARAEVDASVQALEMEIRDTQNNLNYWKTTPTGLDVLRQPAEIERLQNQLADQKAQLNDLRTRRVEISASALNNSQVIQSLAEQARSELRGSATATQEQISSLRSDIDRLQQTQTTLQSRLQGVNLQISKTERELESRSEEIRRLQESIQAKQNEIQSR